MKLDVMCNCRAPPPHLSLDANGHPTVWMNTRNGVSRIVWRRDTAKWLRAAAHSSHADSMQENDDVSLPAAFNIVSSLPDISEVRPKLTPTEYEAWFIQVVQDMLSLLSPDQVAIFYQTPGRCSGEDGSWLDKQYLITAGARAAGALCVWQKIVLFQDSVGRMRGGVRAGWVTMLCFSKRVRVPGDHQTVDVLADRGHMAYAHAMGEDACAAAIEYCIDVSERAAAEEDIEEEEEEEKEDGRPAVSSPPESCKASRRRRVASSSIPILDPFCGYGSVLAVANAYGLPALGLDVSLKCCKAAAEHEASADLRERARRRRETSVGELRSAS